jgi:hypothetical protein
MKNMEFALTQIAQVENVMARTVAEKGLRKNI